MNISKFGEDYLIKYLKSLFTPFKNTKGIGDDCAVISKNKKYSWVITTDSLIEKTHFLKEKISPNDLGEKAIIVNLSDIAAMGGYPLFVFLNIAFPSHISIKWIKSFLNGVKKVCQKENIFLLGGDTSSSKNDIFINVTILGECLSKNIKLRSFAKAKDKICVTGFLGDSNAGLKSLLSDKLKKDKIEKILEKRHIKPTSYIKEGIWLSKQKGVHAMIDVSDGLFKDLKNICKSSSCFYKVELSKLPISKELFSISKKNGWNPYKIAIEGGEDYVLMCTIDEKYIKNIKNRYKKTFNSSLYEIGEITKKDSEIKFYSKKEKFSKNDLNPFEHFS